MIFQPVLETDGRPVGLYFKEDGYRPERPTLILIHGSGGSRASWSKLFQALGGSINAAALVLPGHGDTPGPLAADVGEAAEWVIRLVETWDPPRKPVLGGHSLGGAVSLEVGLTRPDLFSGLALIGTGARLEVNPAIIEGFEKDFTGTVGLVGQWAFFKETDPAIVREASGVLADNRPETLIADFRACDQFDRRSDLGEVALPALVACGRQDKMTGPKLSEALAAGIPGARLELVDRAGHFLADEQPAVLAALIEDFMAGLA